MAKPEKQSTNENSGDEMQEIVNPEITELKSQLEKEKAEKEKLRVEKDSLENGFKQLSKHLTLRMEKPPVIDPEEKIITKTEYGDKRETPLTELQKTITEITEFFIPPIKKKGN